MPVVSQSIRKEIVPVGASTVDCELRTPNCSASSTASSHDCCAAPNSIGGTSSSSTFAASARCIRKHAQHVLAVLGVARERAHPPSRSRGRRVRVAGHECGERSRPRPAGVRVVRHAECHEQRAEVRVAETELTELARRVGDLLRRVVGIADEDLLRGEHDLDRGLVALDIELAVVVEEREEIEAGQIARAVVEVHVFGAVAYDDSVGDVAVIARLAQVVGELDALVAPLDQPRRRLDGVRPAHAGRHDLGQPIRLGAQLEPDLGRKPFDRTRGDAQVVAGRPTSRCPESATCPSRSRCRTWSAGAAHHAGARPRSSRTRRSCPSSC